MFYWQISALKLCWQLPRGLYPFASIILCCTNSVTSPTVGYNIIPSNILVTATSPWWPSLTLVMGRFALKRTPFVICVTALLCSVIGRYINTFQYIYWLAKFVMFCLQISSSGTWSFVELHSSFFFLPGGNIFCANSMKQNRQPCMTNYRGVDFLIMIRSQECAPPRKQVLFNSLIYDKYIQLKRNQKQRFRTRIQKCFRKSNNSWIRVFSETLPNKKIIDDDWVTCY